MGQVTPILQVWTPDDADLDEPDVYLASMAASIDNGAGKRLQLQEKAIGLKAGFTFAGTLPNTLTIANVVITTTNGCFKQGLDIAGGVVTVETPGMYLVSGSLGVTNTTNHTARIELRKGATALVGDEIASNPNYYQAAKATTIVNCVAGDQLSMWICDTLGGAAVAANLSLTHFTVAMIQAVPQ
jgi:hypothetical protein